MKIEISEKMAVVLALYPKVARLAYAPFLPIKEIEEDGNLVTVLASGCGRIRKYTFVWYGGRLHSVEYKKSDGVPVDLGELVLPQYEDD